MARQCSICKIKLSFFYRKPICKHCQATKYDYYLINDNILKLIDLNDKQLTKLVEFGHMDCLYLYNLLFKKYLKYERLSKEHIASLRKISIIFSVEDKTLRYEQKNDLEEKKNKERKELEDIKDLIKKTNRLPIINEYYFNQLKFKLSKNEKYFLSGHTNFYERQILSSYQSSGERIVERGPKLKSQGSFIVTWNTFYYIPKFEGSLITIDLSKIRTYDLDGNYLRIRKNGREKAYLFQMNSFILATCIVGLDFLFNRKHD